MRNLMGKRYLFFAISLAIIIPGIVLISLWGIPFSVDFRGGSLLEAKFASGHAPEPSQVIGLYHNELGIKDVQVSSSGVDTLMIRSSASDESIKAKMTDALSSKFNDQVTAQRFEVVGPTLSQELTSRAILAVAVSSLILVIYIAFVFRGVPHAIRYGVCTVAALLHDVLVMLSVAAIGGRFWGWQIDTMFLTAMLTVIAFSAQDTIVVFDRIRENTQTLRKLPFETLVNHSVVQTLTRSINTQVMAVDFLLLALALFGGVTLKEFSTLLLVGMFSGSYSSGFNAAPLLIVWENREWKTWFNHNKKPADLSA